jgi:predicted DCC family thiol-disulfide oxidoreductase YuxK
MNLDAAWPLTIYYDASCPLCAREIATLAACDFESKLRLVDCSPLEFCDPQATEASLTRAELMRAIHARDEAGRWYRGIDVFALAYQAAGLHGVARAFGHRRWRPVFDWLYPRVAKHRMLLSHLGLTNLYGWLIEFAAKRAARRAQTCRDGACATR